MPRPRTKPFPPVLLRAFAAAGIEGRVRPGHEVTALAFYLGTTPKNVRNWDVENGVIPQRWLEVLAQRSGRSIDWLRDGDQANEADSVQAFEAMLRSEAPPSGGALSTGQEGPSYLGGGATGVSVARASEPTPAWLTRGSPSELDTPRLGAVQKSPAAGILVTKGAGAPVLPLLLSLPLGERGGDEQREYELIPKRMRFAGAGKLTDQPYQAGPDRLDLAGELAMSFEWLKRNLSHTTGQLTTIEVRGDSMNPTLRDGDTIMIDEGVEAVDVDGIYVMEIGGRCLVKRVHHLFDGTLVLISDNTAYQRETIPRHKVPEVRVIGRMVWPRL